MFIKSRLHKSLLLLSILIPLLNTTGCRRTKVNVGVPNCPPPHLVVKIKEGSVSGKDLENMIENHIQDHICIDRLKALLGKKFKLKN